MLINYYYSTPYRDLTIFIYRLLNPNFNLSNHMILDGNRRLSLINQYHQQNTSLLKGEIKK